MTSTAPPGRYAGGTAAALAAKFVTLIPFLWNACIQAAHQPSFVPQRGFAPPGSTTIQSDAGMSVAGPMARSAADLVVELDSSRDRQNYRRARL